VERLIRTIKEEEVYLSEYEGYQDAYRQIGRFIEEVYACKRIRSSLGVSRADEIRAPVAGEPIRRCYLRITEEVSSF